MAGPEREDKELERDEAEDGDIAEESLAARSPEDRRVGRGGRPRRRPIENE